MNSEKPELPRFLHFVWLFFMQPITLSHQLKACGIDDPDARLLKLWFDKDETRPMKRQYVKYLLTLLLIMMPITSLLLLELLILLSYPTEFEKL